LVALNQSGEAHVSGDAHTEVGESASRIAAGDHDALFHNLYPELKRIARSRLRTVGGRTVLDTTMLVHDTYARLAQSNRTAFASDGQFLAYCAQVMRSVIIDLAREQLAARRGGGACSVELNTEIMQSAAANTDDSLDVLRVHDALGQLKALDPRLERIVEMRYFAGLSESEISEALQLSVRTISREWERARALLRAMLSE
jgi:RNA polymerase sigma factor (TIGR02999 family)